MTVERRVSGLAAAVAAAVSLGMAGWGCDSAEKLAGGLMKKDEPKPAAKSGEPDKGDKPDAGASGPAAPTATPTPTEVPDIPVSKEQWEKAGYPITKAGDVLVYEQKIEGAGFSQEQKEEIEVLSAAAGVIAVQRTTTMTMAGVPPQKSVSKQRYVLSDAGYSTKESDDKVTVKDKEYPAKRTDATVQGKLVTKTWVAKELPLGGMARVEDGEGKVLSRLVDFGRAAPLPTVPPDVRSVEMRMPKAEAAKAAYPDAKPGDFIELEQVTLGHKSRTTLLEIGDGYTVSLTDMPGPDGKMSPAKYKTAYVFGPEKAKVGDAEVTVEKMEMLEGGKTMMLTETSKEVPLDGLVVSLTQAAGNKVSRKLVSLKRGK
jgi:hypothetical protein